MVVLAISGYDEEVMYTSYEEIEEGESIYLPAYNVSYIVAYPIEGHNWTAI